MHIQDPNGRLFAVDAWDGIAQRVTNAYDAADNRRFFLVRASNAALAVAFARELNAEWRAKLAAYKEARGI